MIRIQNLEKSFGTKKVLANITFTFNSGIVYGMVGNNGSGKTTLFRCIAGLEEYSGSISSSFTPLKNHLGYVVAEPYFLPKITGEEYLTLLAEARGIKNIDYERWNIFELPLKQYISTYSTGMKKKLSIIAVLCQNNELYILDEPYNGLDMQSAILLTEIIKKLKSLGKTIVISSHIFATLSDSCDEIILLENGLFTDHVLKANFNDLQEVLKNKTIQNNIENMFLIG